VSKVLTFSLTTSLGEQFLKHWWLARIGLKKTNDFVELLSRHSGEVPAYISQADHSAVGSHKYIVDCVNTGRGHDCWALV